MQEKGTWELGQKSKSGNDGVISHSELLIVKIQEVQGAPS